MLKGQIIYVVGMFIILMSLAYLLPFSLLRTLKLILSPSTFLLGSIFISAQFCIVFFAFRWFRRVLETLEDLEVG